MLRASLPVRLLSVVALAAAATGAGCARRQPYALGSASQYNQSAKLATITEPQIERGSRRPVLDGIGWVLGIPGKIVLWDRRIDNHAVTARTEAAVGEYLAANELTAVKVRVNQYAPREDWRRLRANDAVGRGWRYTFGTIAWLGETIFPGRVWGGDHYNPYTNTIYLFSDVPAVALHEAGHAKDFARRDWPGTYAALYTLPVVPLWHEALATRDALGYVREFGTADDEREALTLLYPAYGTYVGGAIGDWVPGYGWAAYAAAVAGGHIAGRVKAAQVEDRPWPKATTRDWTGLSAMSPQPTAPPGPNLGAEEFSTQPYANASSELIVPKVEADYFHFDAASAPSENSDTLSHSSTATP